ncbi:conserved protein, unknown function, partial [Hepatocystis sp. ex Piliocolobus tephrosceles]
GNISNSIPSTNNNKLSKHYNLHKITKTMGSKRDDNKITVDKTMEKCSNFTDKEIVQYVEKLNSDNVQIQSKKKKLKKINYKNLITNKEAVKQKENTFFNNLKGFYKYYEHLFNNCLFDKKTEIKLLCKSIIQVLINKKDIELIIQLICIKNFSTSSLFSKELKSFFETLKLTNIMLFKELFATEKNQNYNAILVMCKHIKNINEKKQILLFMEAQMIKKKLQSSSINVMKILNALSVVSSNIEQDIFDAASVSNSAGNIADSADSVTGSAD